MSKIIENAVCEHCGRVFETAKGSGDVIVEGEWCGSKYCCKVDGQLRLQMYCSNCKARITGEDG